VENSQVIVIKLVLAFGMVALLVALMVTLITRGAVSIHPYILANLPMDAHSAGDAISRSGITARA
jgi:hypothetical protein